MNARALCKNGVKTFTWREKNEYAPRAVVAVAGKYDVVKLFFLFLKGGAPRKIKCVSLNVSLVAVSFYRHTTEFLTISLQHKNANIANFVLVVPFKINTTIEVCNLEV